MVEDDTDTKPSVRMGIELKTGTDINKIAQALNMTTQAAEELLRSSDKDWHDRTVKLINEKTKELVNSIPELGDEYNKFLDLADKVLRKAWGLACIDLGVSEAEFPSRY